MKTHLPRHPILVTADHSRHPVLLTLLKLALLCIAPTALWLLLIHAISPFVP